MNRKNRIVVVLILGLALFGASRKCFAESTLILECERASATGEGRTIYQVTSDSNRYTLIKIENNIERGRIELKDYDSVAGYGGTYLFYQNQGRSGYLLVYFHKGSLGGDSDRALIDINLFQSPVRPLNSDGPRTDFQCKAR